MKTTTQTTLTALAALNLKKHDAIVRVIDRCLREEVWLSKAQQEVVGWLDKTEKPLRRRVETLLEAEWKEQGAGYLGRWQ